MSPRSARSIALLLAASTLSLSACSRSTSSAGHSRSARASSASSTARWRSPLHTTRPERPFPTLAAPAAPPLPADAPDRVDDVLDAAYEAEQRRDFERAIALHYAAFDAVGASAAYDLGSAYARAERPDAALYFLQVAIDASEATTDALRRDSNLDMIRPDRRFDALVAYAEAMDAMWTAMHHRVVRVTVPTGYDARAPLPTVVALHGWLSEPGDFFDDPLWQALADANSIAIVSVSATLASGVRKFAWTSDAERDLRHVRDALASVRGQVRVDRAHVVLIGFSQGADASLRLLDAAPDEFRGVISMSPGSLPGASEFDVIHADLHGHTVILTVGAGEHPDNVAQARVEERIARQAGARTELRVVEGQNTHRFPDDLEVVLPAWLAKIDPVFASE